MANEDDKQVLKAKKPVVLKEFLASLGPGVKLNNYSLIVTDNKGHVKLWLQKKNENKKKRKRPDNHSKADGSLLILQSGFAAKVA